MLLVAVSIYGVILMVKGWRLLEQQERDNISEIVGIIAFLLMMLAFVLLAVSV
jgi:hypothetical protein